MRQLGYFLIFTCCLSVLNAQEIAERRTVKLMGSRFDITIVANDSLTANTYIDDAISEIKRIENLISSWNPDSQTTMINANAGIKPVVIDQELIDLILRAKQIKYGVLMVR